MDKTKPSPNKTMPKTMTVSRTSVQTSGPKGGSGRGNTVKSPLGTPKAHKP